MTAEAIQNAMMESVEPAVREAIENHHKLGQSVVALVDDEITEIPPEPSETQTDNTGPTALYSIFDRISGVRRSPGGRSRRIHVMRHSRTQTAKPRPMQMARTRRS